MAFWPFRYEVRVVWRDLDAAGHVNNAVYLTYMESARTAAYYALTVGTEPRDLDIILARATIDFRSPASLHDNLLVDVTPGRVGATSFTLAYTIRERASGRIVAEGESVQVAFDYVRNAKKPISDALRAKLAVGA